MFQTLNPKPLAAIQQRIGEQRARVEGRLLRLEDRLSQRIPENICVYAGYVLLRALCLSIFLRLSVYAYMYVCMDIYIYTAYM